jgi:hypothetical protein
VAEDEVVSKGKAKKAGKKAPVKAKQPPLVSITSVVGGLSVQKQRRLLTRGCDILVATPGRLWDLCQEVSVTGVFFVVDANFCLETGCGFGYRYQADQVPDCR